MTEEKFAAILAKQMPDAEKRATRRISLSTPAAGFAAAERQVRRYPACARGRPGRMLPDPTRRRSGADACARSSSIPRPPGIDPAAGDRVVEIGASSSSTTSRPAGLPRLSQPERAMSAGRVRRPRPDRRLPGRQAALRRDRRRASRLHRRCAARDPQRRLRHRLPQRRARPPRRAAARCRPASSTPWRWRAASIPARRTTSTRSARATASTIRGAPSTARCSTPRSWPKSISS